MTLQPDSSAGPAGGADGPPIGNDDEAVAVLDRQIGEARGLILGSGRYRRGGDPLHAVPWLLVMGEGGETRSLLATAAIGSPFPPPQRLGETAAVWWYWWLLDEVVAIETAPMLFGDPASPIRWRLYEQALGLLVRYRPNLPFDGMVLTVPAMSLIQRAAGVAALGGQMRAMVDEAYRTLAIRFPVFLVVTGCESVPGHDAFFRALPSDTSGQAIGHRIDVDRTTLDPCEDLDPFFAGLQEKFHRMRLGILGRDVARHELGQLFAFPLEFGQMRTGLKSLCRALTEPNRFDHRPMYRGFYFTAANSVSPHIIDLFRRFLPADASLARPA